MSKGTAAVLFRRILTSFIVLFLLISLLFILVRLSPGDPFLKFISPELSPRLVEQVRASFNLDKSLPEQYWGFLVNAVKGDFGYSYDYRMPVFSVIGEFLPFTVLFSSISFLLQLLISFALSYFAVKKINSSFDKTISKLTILFFATPVFVSGVFLIYLFSEVFNIFPSSGLRSFGISPPGLTDYLRHLVLPFIALSLVEVSIFFRYIRDNLEDVYNKPFVTNLRANGFGEKHILLRHVIPNALNPFITIAGLELGILLGGTLITEVIFALPGMGRLAVAAIFSRDYPLIIGCSFTAGVMIILANLLADIIKVLIDKRLLREGLN
jgi:peptide/nickel transport system permease protein